MTQEKKRNYRRKPVDNLASAATEMGNIPPQALDMEEAVLGAMMVNPDSVDQVMDLLKTDAFYDLKNRFIFEAIYELFNEPVGFFSLEMTTMELMERLIATHSGISSDKLKGRQKLLPDEWQILEQSSGRISKAPLYIDETPGITLTEFVTKAKRLVREKGVKIIFVDYLQLIHSGKPQVGGFSKVQEVT